LLICIWAAHETEIRQQELFPQYKLSFHSDIKPLASAEGGHGDIAITEKFSTLIDCIGLLGLCYEDATKPANALKFSKGYRTLYLNLKEVESRNTTNCVNYIESCWANLKGDPIARKQPKKPPTDPLAELDAWVEENKDKVSKWFERQPEVKNRRLRVPLQARIIPDSNDEEPPRDCFPEAEDFKDSVSAGGNQMILIWEDGGAGKTSLAFQIARWGLNKELADHTVLPFLLDPAQEDQENLIDQIVKVLGRNGVKNLEMGRLQQLLEHKRLLLIVDHYTELTDDARDWVKKSLPVESLVLLTARLDVCNEFVRGHTIKQVKPLRLEREQLFDFFEAYLNVKPEPHTPADKKRIKGLLERMVGNKPVTVLLAKLVIDSASFYINNRPDDVLPTSVPDLIRDYIGRISDPIPNQERLLKDSSSTKINHAWLEPSLRALALKALSKNGAYFPQNLEFELAKEAMKPVARGWMGWRDGDDDLLLHWLGYMEKRLNLLQRQKGGSDLAPVYRIALDPVADYLAAMALQMECEAKGSPKEQLDWIEGWIDELKRRSINDVSRLDDMRGFLAACRECFLDMNKLRPNCNDSSLQDRWTLVPVAFAKLAGIDIRLERWLEVKNLIFRLAEDVKDNQVVRSKAIAELSGYAQEFAAVRDQSPAFQAALAALKQVVPTLGSAMVKPALLEEDRIAAAEALGRIGGGEAANALVRMIQNANEPSVAVRRAAAESLGLVDASLDNPEAHWDLLKGLLAEEANHLHGETHQAVIDARLPLLQGASRGLQRLAGRCSPFSLPTWGDEKGLEVPMLTLTTSSAAVTTEVVPVKLWQLPLPGGLPLELVAIPEGGFWMGSPEQEEARNAYGHLPEAMNVDVEAWRWVRLPAFAMARTPINQAQWRAVADLPQVERQLNVDPAQVKGAELPVECVSWNDANEWCARLNRYLGPHLAETSAEVMLPSEAQWEYACRAGSDSAFHFGDTIDAAWANYCGNYTYGNGNPGVYLNRTSPVGAYELVNRWGLADMHGNVWEWCRDRWHPSPDEGPTDGSAWLAPAADLPGVIAQRRLLRGGSWYFIPGNCRSAYRSFDLPDLQHYDVGFRVCCLPQD
jgi:formylglycine-generating enzyme required for sulfatase activity